MFNSPLLKYIALTAGLLLALSVNAAQDLYPFKTPKQRQQFHSLTQNLRCLVCQNQNVADSNAPLARDIRAKVYTLVLKGYDDQKIKDYFVERYGYFILFQPPVTRSTLLLWALPVVLLILGGGIGWRIMLKRRRL